MASASIRNTTSATATGEIVGFDPPVSTITAQAAIAGPAGTTGTGSFLVETSLDGINWTTLIAASTFNATRTLSSTSAHLVSAARARLTAHASGSGASVFLTGK